MAVFAGLRGLHIHDLARMAFKHAIGALLHVVCLNRTERRRISSGYMLEIE